MASHSIDAGGVIVAAFGAATVLGLDAPTAFAAARAQLSRAITHPQFRMRSEVEGVEEPVIVHAAPLVTAGFEGPGRLFRLAQAALIDLLGSCEKLTDPWRDATFYVAACGRPGAVPAQPAAPDAAQRMARGVAMRAAAAAQWPRQPEIRFVGAEGHTAGIRALGAAARDLMQGTVPAAVVLAFDSLLDEPTLQALATHGRLKCDGVPAGLQPGEAAAAVLLLPPQSASAPVWRLVAAATDDEPDAPDEAWVCTGEALSRALLTAWSRGPASTPWLLSDHNGEHARAYEWGCTLARLRGEGSAFEAPPVSYPAMAHGDTGAASALLSVGTALHLAARRAAPSAQALVAASSDGPARAALLMQHL